MVTHPIFTKFDVKVFKTCGPPSFKQYFTPNQVKNSLIFQERTPDSTKETRFECIIADCFFFFNYFSDCK